MEKSTEERFPLLKIINSSFFYKNDTIYTRTNYNAFKKDCPVNTSLSY